MTANLDIRWQQRLNSFTNTCAQLEAAVLLSTQRPLSHLEEQGLIKAFEFTYGLAWNVMKDYLLFQGDTEMIGSRDAIRGAFKAGLIADGERWMDMINSRNQTSHLYNDAVAKDIATRVITVYFPLFKTFQQKMESLKSCE